MLDLDADPRPGGVPAPGRILRRGSDLHRFGPGDAVIVGARHPYRAGALALLVDDLGLVIHAEIMGQQQPHRAGVAVDHGTRVAAGVGAIVPDYRLRAPRAAAVARTFHEHVNVTGIAPPGATPFREGEQRAVRGPDDRRNAIRVIAVGAGGEDVGLDEISGGGGRGGCDVSQEDGQNEIRAK